MSNMVLSAIFVLATAFANVMQKKAISSLGPVQGLSVDVIRRLALSPYMWCGMTAYVLALGMYLALLTRVPLNVATSIAALNFIAVLLASRLVLGEPIPPLRYVGFGCILLGIYVVSLTQRAAR
jgi:drug/metabolite transporter (DMT)-like permease